MMGYDYLLWGRELVKENLLSKDARLVAMTSEGLAACPEAAVWTS